MYLSYYQPGNVIMQATGKISSAGLLMLLVCSLTSFAQDYTLSGRVRELERVTGAPQSEVRIDIDNSKIIAFTNADGTFSIPGVPAGTHTIRVSKPGFVGFYKANYILDGNKTLNISLLDTMQESPGGQLPLVLDEFRELSPFTQYKGLTRVNETFPNSLTWNDVTEGNLIPILLLNARASDSLAFRNAIGACNGNWQDSPAGSVENKQKRALYLLTNDPAVSYTKRGIRVGFQGTQNNTGILDHESDMQYIDRAEVNIASNLGRILKKEVKGRCEEKNDIFARPSYMNSNSVDMTDLDHMLNIVFHNYWAAIARNEQNVNILDLENTPAFGVPTATSITMPANNASDLGKAVRIQYDNIFGADKYRLQISTMEDFSTILKDLNVYRNDTALVLDPHTTYYARVQAINSAGNGPVSSTVKFSTGFTTSSEDKTFSDLRVYPVPVRDYLNIEYPPLSSGTRNIFSSGGILLNSKEIFGEPEIVDMTVASPGIYIIQFSDGKKIKSLRIVKR